VRIRSYEKLFAKVSEAAEEDLAALRAEMEQMKVNIWCSFDDRFTSESQLLCMCPQLDHRAEIQGLFERIDELHSVIRVRSHLSLRCACFAHCTDKL
jgi:head-tail adaptor